MATTARNTKTQPMSTKDKLIAARNDMLKRKHAGADAAPVRKPRAKKTVVSEPVVQSSFDEDLMTLIKRHLGDVAIPSWKRAVFAFVVGATAAAGFGWLVGTVAGYAMIGVLAMSHSMSLVYLIYALAMLLAVYGGMKVSQKVGGYIVSGNIDRDIAKGWGWVKSKFTREPQGALA